jgi:hypothetical protein
MIILITSNDGNTASLKKTEFDDLDIWDVWMELIRPCLAGYGFEHELIDELVGTEDE